MAERVRTEISSDVIEAVRRLARDEGRNEGEVIEEALVLFLALRNHFVGLPAGGSVQPDILSSPGLGNLREFFEYIDRWQRRKGIEPLSDEEAMSLANEELHAMRRERRAKR
jgi:hypothetical protein